MTGRTILLGVTSPVSLTLMEGWPGHLARQGWDVHVVSGPGGALEGLDLLEADVTVHPVSMRRDPAPLRDLAGLVNWIRVLRRVRPDVVMIGTPKAALLGLFAAFLTGVPVRVYLLRGLRSETIAGLPGSVLRTLERVSSACSHIVVAVSESLAAAYVDQGLARSEKVVVIGRGSSNGVDLDRFRPREDGGREPRRVVVGFIGRLTLDKGLLDLAEAERLLVERQVDHALLIVGGLDTRGSHGQTWPSGADVTETGHLDDVTRVLEEIDVLVLPTHREGFPNVVLEASAAGVPVVTTDATGAVDSVLHQHTGLVIPAHDPVALADALESLASDAGLRRDMGRAGRHFVEEFYDQERVWMAMESFLSDRLRGRSWSPTR